MKDLKVGDKVWMGCYTSIGASSEGECTIEAVDYRYNQKTGEKYKVYKVGSSWYNEAGGDIEGGSMYYIEEMHTPSKPVPKKRVIDKETAEIYDNFDKKETENILDGIFEDLINDLVKKFEPRKGLAERYGTNSLTAEDNKEIKKAVKMKESLVQKYLNRGYSQEQAEAMAMAVMYIAGFSGPTFKN